ncbi:MmgE/PrpD family protein [Roseococcus sp. DSY-14]|uniref:MmgE/PrpD family protein n=1 Tax=Roseococcus sp. DSY-14 TaxID=3369650 RepID=UPI00387AA9AD
MSAEARLAGTLAAARWDDLPEAPRRAARRMALNIAACAIGGATDPDVARFAAVLGRSPGECAYLNALAANILDFDDQHLPTVMHPGSVVVPAAAVAAELAGAGGQDLLAALACGTEAALRVALAVSPGHYAAGFHITATCGVFGAAVAAGRLLGLDGARMLDALGHAACQSAGLVAGLGAASKGAGVGAAARAGLEAALLARAGLRGPAAPLTGAFGFLAVQPAATHPAALTEGLGEDWDCVRNLPKPFPVGVVLHPVVDAALALRAAGWAAEAIAGAVLHGPALLRQRADRPAPRDAREATVSAQHVFAAAFLRGRLTPAELSPAALADPAIRGLAARVSVAVDQAVPQGGVRLAARRADGVAHEAMVPVGTGLPGREMDDALLAAKAHSLLASGAPPQDGAALAALAAALEAGAPAMAFAAALPFRRMTG